MFILDFRYVATCSCIADLLPNNDLSHLIVIILRLTFCADYLIYLQM